MKMNDFTAAIKRSYDEQFPESLCSAKYNGNIWRSITVTCKLAGNRDEVSGGIWENDILHISFSIATEAGELPKGTTEESELPETLVLEIERKSYMIAPTPAEPYNAYSRRILKFRKTTGTPEKIVKTFSKYFKDLKAQLETDLNAGAIHPNHIEIVKAKINL